VKLFLACVAALSLAGCAEEPTSTSGDNEVNVLGTKEGQQLEREENPWQAKAANLSIKLETLTFSDHRGVWAETLVPEFDGRTCLECNFEIMAVHQNNGFRDEIELWNEGSLMCHLVMTPAGLLRSTCPDDFIVGDDFVVKL
jgi:hypothetical protein